MTIKELVEIINKVCGLGEYWAESCIYYCMTTHYLPDINWMPVLILKAPPGSGKSGLIQVLSKLCFEPIPITCHERMTSASLRNKLIEAEDKTAIIEEGDLYPNRKQLESYLINRVDRKRTASIPVTEQYIDNTGATRWKTETPSLPGATILHDRHSLTDMAVERRSITVPIRHDTSKKYVKPTEPLLNSLSLPSFGLGDIPDIFDAPETRGSGLDTWEPLIRVANYMNDDDWLGWAWEQVAEANDALSDGYQYELENCTFGAIIAAYCENSGMGLIPSKIVDNPLPLATVTKVVKESYSWIAPKTIGSILRRWNITVRNKGGKAHIFTTIDQLRKIAKEIGYEDSAL